MFPKKNSKNENSSVGVYFISLTLCLCINTAQAGSISSIEKAMVSQGVIPNADFLLLTEFFGFQANVALNYQSVIDLSGWSSTLSGTYLGKNLNINYFGDLSSISSGLISWSSSGSYGSDNWNGSGQMLFTEPTDTEFNVDFDMSLIVGGNLGSMDLLINGIVTDSSWSGHGGQKDGDMMLTNTSGEVVVNSLLSSVADFELAFPFPQEIGDPGLTSINVDGNTNIAGVWELLNVNSGGVSLNSTITTVSEPNTIILLSISFIALLRYDRKRKKMFFHGTTVS